MHPMSKKEKKPEDVTPEEQTEQAVPTEETEAEAPNPLLEELEALKDQTAQQEDKYLRLAAEYDNYRKRTAREKDAIYPDAVAATVEKFLPVLDNFLDAAYMGNLPNARIIHGKGTGVLRKAVQDELRRCKYVKSFRLGVYGEGEDGVTIAEFK